MKDIIKTAIVLSLIAIIAGVLLGTVNNFTYLSDEQKLERNLKKVYENGANFEEVDVSGIDVPSDTSARIKRVDTCDVQGKKIYIYSTNVKGYKKNLELMIAIEDNKIVNILKTASGETIAKPLASDNLSKYYGIDVTTIKGFYTTKQPAVDGKEKIDAIGGATLSSNGICNSVDLVVYYHNKLVGGGK